MVYEFTEIWQKPSYYYLQGVNGTHITNRRVVQNCSACDVAKHFIGIMGKHKSPETCPTVIDFSLCRLLWDAQIRPKTNFRIRFACVKAFRICWNDGFSVSLDSNYCASNVYKIQSYSLIRCAFHAVSAWIWLSSDRIINMICHSYVELNGLEWGTKTTADWPF